MKPIRKAVRTFLIEDEKVLTIKYTTQDNKLSFYDIPGGKIEDGETSVQAAIREFKEESGIDIYNVQYVGNLIVEYPSRIYDFEVFITHDYKGMPQETVENISEWVRIDELLQKDKLFTEIYLLDSNHKTDLLNKTNFKKHFVANENHQFIDEVFYEDMDDFWSEAYYKDNIN